ncbi:hypothetical protein CLV46_0973 [Diaminobutyricimonas aerilata]|uniref:DUF559 domain-containing protein n=1 Tax=Diaminobutyricimonas aerilata TaxID=1162967 RepID=A0A2M9CHR4_9MICO|nr:hypothetical protein CLV46_0973 [Diaminobutyricimonas aerilata]
MPADGFASAEARRLGVARSRLRASDVSAPFRGVRIIAEPSGLRARCRAYLATAVDGAVFTHVTAAVLLGIPLPRRLESQWAIDVSAPVAVPRMRGVRGHRIGSVAWWACRDVGGLPVVTPEAVWVQLASYLELEDLVVATDHLLRRKRPQSTSERLIDTLARAGGARGVRRLREAMDLARPLTDSPMETRLRLLLVRNEFPEPVIRHPIHDDTGAFIGHPDLAYVAERIAFEYEGEGHRLHRTTFVDDIDRRERMEDAGWRCVRVVSDDIARPHALLERTRRLLHQRRSRS